MATAAIRALWFTALIHSAESQAFCSSNDTAEECEKLLCQCAPHAYSNHQSVQAGKNAITNDGPYDFIGCGAHTGYITPSNPFDEVGRTPEGYKPYSDQIGGYPFRWCFTVGGTECSIGGTGVATQTKNVLNPKNAWKTCSGHLECNADISGPVIGGSELSTHDLDDWTDCCKVCSETSGCAQWQFELSSVCTLFSDVSTPAALNSNNKTHFTGTPGHDDPPLDCVSRNDYDTCDIGPECPDMGFFALSIKDPTPSPWCEAGLHRCFIDDPRAAPAEGSTILACVTAENVDQCTHCAHWFEPRGAFQWGIVMLLIACCCFSCATKANGQRARRQWESIHLSTIISESVVLRCKTSETRTRSTKHGTQRYKVTVYTTDVTFPWEDALVTQTFKSDGKPKFAEGSTVAFRVRNYQNEELGFCISCDIFTAGNMRTIKYVHGRQSPTDTPALDLYRQHWIYDARLAKKSDIRIASQPRVAKGEKEPEDEDENPLAQYI